MCVSVQCLPLTCSGIKGKSAKKVKDSSKVKVPNLYLGTVLVSVYFNSPISFPPLYWSDISYIRPVVNCGN